MKITKNNYKKNNIGKINIQQANQSLGAVCMCVLGGVCLFVCVCGLFICVFLP